MARLSHPALPAPAKMASIEMLRGLAACLVVFSHVARHVDRHVASPDLITLFQAGHAGVDLFFTLSGFIIFFVHRSDIGRPDRLPHYLARRFTRVWPLYWLALFVSIGMNYVAHPTVLPLETVLWWAALLPTAADPLFAISWTLQYEAMFYVCFAILIVDRWFGALVLGGWLLLIIAFSRQPWAPALCGVFGLQFLFGLLAAQALHSVPITRPVLFAAIGASALAAFYTLESTGMMNGYANPAHFAYGFAAALTIVGVAAAERAGHRLLPSWLEPLGRASYSIYLFQFILIGTVWQTLRATGTTDLLGRWALFILLATAAIAGGLAANRWIEQPILRAIRSRRRPALSEGMAIPS